MLGKTGDRPRWRPLVDPDRLRRQHERWVEAETYRNWTGPWFKAYHYKRAGLPPHWPLEILASDANLMPSTGPTGVALLYDERFGGSNFQHLFRLLRDRIIDLGYELRQADERTWQGAAHTETLAKYLLLPQPGTCAETGGLNQRFGQVCLDLLTRNRRPAFIRLLITPLPDADRLFAPPRSFDDLLATILGCDEER